MHFYFQGLSGFCGWIYNAYNDVIIKGLNLKASGEDRVSQAKRPTCPSRLCLVLGV